MTRRYLPGLWVRSATLLLKPLLFALRTRSRGNAGVTIYASYMAGDFFMALPALKFLKKSMAPEPVRVLCRPDCAEFLRIEGIEAIPFPDTFRIRPGLRAFLRSLRAAWALRGRLGDAVLDLDADPRTAFWLKIAGVRRAVSYRRAAGSLFDETFALPEPSTHQADRDLRVVEEWVKRSGGRRRTGGTPDLAEQKAPSSNDPSTARPPPPTAPWLLSLWTRKASKNWPLERWDALLERFSAHGIPFVIVTPPDGDAAFQAFQARWKGRAPFLSGTLTEIAEAVRAGAGVVATDNFLGHMAGYFGRPVLWINQCSPAEQVMPRGPRTVAVTTPTVDEAWAAFRGLQP